MSYDIRAEELIDVSPDDPFWSCDGFRPVQAHTAGDAASVFADRMARRLGRRGRVGAVREDLRTQNGSWYSFEIFIGKRQPDGMISGHNEWLEITRVR